MGELYSENLMCKYELVILLVVGFLTLALFYYTIREILPWLFAVPLVIFFMAFLMGSMSIKVTTEGVSVRYGMFRFRVDMKDICGAHEDSKALMTYGGPGIKVLKKDGKLVMAYIAIGYPRVVLLLRNSRYSEFVFSTYNPNRVLTAINMYARPDYVG